VCLKLSEIRLKNSTSVKNSVKSNAAKRATKGFDLKSATPIRKTDLDGFYAAQAAVADPPLSIFSCSRDS
jgi:hypothetical protein